MNTLAEWAKEEKDANIWNHQGIETLDINKGILDFLQGKIIHDDNTKGSIEVFRQLILSCLQVMHSKRPGYHEILALSIFNNNTKNKNREHGWIHGPILASQNLQPDETGIDESAKKKEPLTANDPLADLPLSHIYHLWRLAGGDVEVNLVKRGVFLSMPVIERLPRVCYVEDGEETGPVMVDTTQLYSDTVQILSYKELYQRLEQEQGQRSSERFEWDADYFNVVDENDVNFLLKESDKFKKQQNGNNSHNLDGEDVNDDNGDDDDDLVFDDEILSPQSSVMGNGPLSGGALITSPGTPSTTRSLNRTFSFNSMNRSRSQSSSSLSINTPAPSTPTQASIPRRSLSLREQDVNYQYHRQRLFAELLRQYPASQKEIIHHAKVDIPPLLRNKIWAAILDVHGDTDTEYERIDKYNDITSDRQVSYFFFLFLTKGQKKGQKKNDISLIMSMRN